MPRKYTDKERKFIEDICKGKTTYEITELFNKQFNSSITRSQLRSYMKNHNLKNGIDRATLSKTFCPKIFTDEQRKFIEDNATGLSNKELTQEFNSHFQLNLIVSQIKALKKNNHIDSGLTGRFEKGHSPVNKGVKGIIYEGCKKTWFKKGNIPANHRPVGSERVSVDGYTEIKVAEPNKWRLKHNVIWEEHNGPIPKGYVVLFGDRNKLNLDINNLILVTNEKLLTLNRYKLIKNDADLTRTGVIIADLYQKIGERKSKAK